MLEITIFYFFFFFLHFFNGLLPIRSEALKALSVPIIGKADRRHHFPHPVRIEFEMLRR